MKQQIPNEADAVMLNPKFLQQLKEECQQEDNDIPQYLKDHLQELEESPSHGIDNEIVKYIVDYISDPMNSTKYRNHILFGNPSDVGRDEESIQNQGDGWSIFIPVFSTTF